MKTTSNEEDRVGLFKSNESGHKTDAEYDMIHVRFTRHTKLKLKAQSITRKTER